MISVTDYQRLIDENQNLRDDLQELTDLLRKIGAYAHEKSTGPAVDDGYCRIREMAYDAL